MESWSATLADCAEADAAFDAVRAAFNGQVRRREEAVAAASDALESAFDFMERAFPDGQEMVVFVNELALGPDSAPFLADNECERFEQYSQKLLLHAGEDELLAELERERPARRRTQRGFLTRAAARKAGGPPPAFSLPFTAVPPRSIMVRGKIL